MEGPVSICEISDSGSGFLAAVPAAGQCGGRPASP
jgi:hypothetical protein